MSTQAADTCPSCGADLPGEARFCPACGNSVDDPVGTTLRVEVPPSETGPVPVSLSHAEPHWFGTTPPFVLLGVAAGCVVLAVVLFATGHWPFGLILLGVGALLLAAFLELVRRRPAWTGSGPSSGVQERAESAWAAWRVRAGVSTDVRRIRTRLMQLESERRGALLELGTAAYRGDPAHEAHVRERLADLESREAELQRELQERLERAAARIREARLPVEETVMVTPPGPSAPYPPPDEGNPPTPPVGPEPYPPPDEGNPPLPAPVPEPTPDPEPGDS